MKPVTANTATARQDGVARSPFPFRAGLQAAVVAVGTSLPLLVARHPGTPLRVLAVAAISAVLRTRGTRLRPDGRQAVIAAMELGALLNDRFDGDAADPAALRRQVAWFARSPHRHVVWDYARKLRHHERSRPSPGAPAGVIKHYRENVNRISLALLWALACGSTLAAAEPETRQAGDLRLLFSLVMLTQVLDDVIDADHDRSHNLPSFATASGVTAASLRVVVSSYSTAIPWRLDGNFCLRLALGLVALLTRGMIAIRPARAFRHSKP
jgi:hypothetical protein